ncbi:hypothetical protein [Gordonia malaquae]|uniref:hypothetical protein n=1 Tax=Gordonia malaquae TaxID=410332 RepID=UPI0030172E3D
MPPTLQVTADWRRATASEIRSYRWEFPPQAVVFVLPHVEIEFKNVSPEKIWIREAWIDNKWISSDGGADSSRYIKGAGAYASVVPKPYSSSADNDAQSVQPGDTIRFTRDWDTSGYLPDAEFADTNGIAPTTYVEPGNFSWWFDSPDHRSSCDDRPSSAPAQAPK